MSIILGILFGALFPIIVVVTAIYFIVGRTDKDKSLDIKEFFTEVGLYSTLVVSLVSFISILFAAIDKKFQDVLSSTSYEFMNVNSDIAFMVSVLVVVFPLYLTLAWLKSRHFSQNPKRREVKAFEYGIYLTIVSTALFVIGSLISVIYNFLMGELSAVFMYKVAIIALVSAALFAYSLFSLKRNFSKKTYIPLLATIVSLSLVLFGVIYSIMILGTPAEMRKRKFDDMRLQSLSEIQSQVLSYWQRQYKLPASISEIKSDGMDYSFLKTKDPKTNKEYSYEVVSNSQMEKQTGEACRNFYPSRYSTTPNIENVSCEIPGKAVFKICAEFDTVRVYDENGIDQSRIGYNAGNSLGLPSATSMVVKDIGYYGGGTDRNPNWNHDKGSYCFERTIDPVKYPSFK